jgi:hypothetical protein
MREREEVPAFSEYWYNKGVRAGYQMHREKVEALAAATRVTVTDAMVEVFIASYADHETLSGLDFTHWDGVKTGLEAAITAALEVPRD